jgi:hypothetical protein
MLSRTATGLCLDDSGVLRGVALVSTLRGISVLRTGRWEAAPAGGGEGGAVPASWMDLLRRARDDGFALSGQVVVGLPSHSTFQKRLSFPFRGRPRITSVLRPALEGEIPLAPDQTEVDFLSLPAAGKGSEVLAIACPRESAEAVRGAFSPAEGKGTPLPLLQTDAFGLAAAAVHLGVDGGAALWVRGEGAVLVRLAGARVAEIRRLRGSTPADLARQAALVLEEAGGGEGELLLCGPARERLSLRPALREAGIARVLEGEDPPLLRGAGADDPGALLPALGLALTGLGRGVPSFDLLHRDAGEGAGWGWTAPRARLATLAGAALLLACAGFLTDYLAAQRELAFYSGSLKASYGALFPGEKLVRDTEVAQIKVRIRVLEQKVSDYTLGSGGAGERSDPLRVMGELSKAAPVDLDLKLEELAIEPGRLRLDGSLPAFDAIDRFKQALEGSPVFTGVKVQNARVGANAGRVSFRLQAEVK